MFLGGEVAGVFGVDGVGNLVEAGAGRFDGGGDAFGEACPAEARRFFSARVSVWVRPAAAAVDASSSSQPSSSY
ncbi:hypothetical protein, partial [Streptomyces sp. SID3343]|uniref:hypothetical protein n=1 Tax=Streptomyces sp. SID3343 TaxID=2690260 RepID=UPI001F2720A3